MKCFSDYLCLTAVLTAFYPSHNKNGLHALSYTPKKNRMKRTPLILASVLAIGMSMIERAFRMNKTDLDIRPIYHRLFNRIEAHVCICFTAYTIMLELERILKEAKSSITLDRARFLTEGIYALNYVNPYNKQHRSVLLRTDNDPETHELLNLLGKI